MGVRIYNRLGQQDCCVRDWERQWCLLEDEGGGNYKKRKKIEHLISSHAVMLQKMAFLKFRALYTWRVRNYERPYFLEYPLVVFSKSFFEWGRLWGFLFVLLCGSLGVVFCCILDVCGAFSCWFCFGFYLFSNLKLRTSAVYLFYPTSSWCMSYNR